MLGVHDILRSTSAKAGRSGGRLLVRLRCGHMISCAVHPLRAVTSPPYPAHLHDLLRCAPTQARDQQRGQPFGQRRVGVC